MKFRAVLYNVSGLERPKVNYSDSSVVLEGWANGILAGLSESERDTAYVKIEEQHWEPVRVIDAVTRKAIA